MPIDFNLSSSKSAARASAAVKAVMDAIKAVGITAYDAGQPFGDLLKHAMLLPIVDWGNVGGRMRQLQQLMLSPTYDPWASTFGPTETSE